MFSRRPVSVLSTSDGRTSPSSIKRLLTCATVRLVFCAHNNAAATDTCGADIEVPVKNVYVSPFASEKEGSQTFGGGPGSEQCGVVLRIVSPGAARSTVVAPTCENVVASASD